MKASQLELPLTPRLKVINGLGQKKPAERLSSRDAVARVLIEAGADMLLRRISPQRAEAIEQDVEEILALFDRVEEDPRALPELAKRLDQLEGLMRETRERRSVGK
jgi:hypothetical protein